MVSLPTMLATAGRSGCDAVSARLCSTGASGLVRALVDVGGEVIEGHELHGLVTIVEGCHRQGDPPACQGLAEVFLVQVAKPAFANLLRPIETAGWSFREGRRIAGLLAADLRAELPSAAPGIAIDCSGPLKLCVPQRLLADPTPGLAHLQLRVSEAASGRLRILADGRPVWERALSCLPERRLLVPLAALRLPPDTRRLEVAFLTSGH